MGRLSGTGVASGSDEEESMCSLCFDCWVFVVFSGGLGCSCRKMIGDMSIISSSSSSMRASLRISSTHSCASSSLGASIWKLRAGEKRPKTCLALRFGSFWRATAVRSERGSWCRSFVPSGGSL